MDLALNLRAFLAVARCGSFSEAARQLHVVPSVVAKRVDQLEHALGHALFERSTRKVALTEAGQSFQPRARALVADLDDVLRSFRRDDDQQLEGHILLMAPTTLTAQVLSPLLAGFLREHANITMELALVDRSANPVEEGFDLAISGHAASYEGVVDVPLCPLEQVLCAAPAYLARRGTPAHPRDLADHDGLFFKPLGTTWRFDSERGAISVDPRPKLVANDNGALCTAAVMGNGIAMLPRYVVFRALDEGTLRPLLPDYATPHAWFRAHVARRRRNLARIEALLDWLAHHLARGLPGSPSAPAT